MKEILLLHHGYSKFDKDSVFTCIANPAEQEVSYCSILLLFYNVTFHKILLFLSFGKPACCWIGTGYFT